MVLETLLRPESVESNPWEMFFYSILITSVALWVSVYVFPSAASILSLFLITLASFPLFYKILADEEQVDETDVYRQMPFMERHGRTMKVFTYFFLGVVAATSFWATVMDDGKFESVFAEQIDTISDIKGDWYTTANALTPGTFTSILFNNIRVSTIAFLMSFLFGTGAIFILAWNASVLSVFATGTAKSSASLIVGHLSALLSISLHAIPEFLAYFLAGIAGGILSIGLIKGQHKTVVMEDAFVTFAVSILVLVVAAFLETFVAAIL